MAAAVANGVDEARCLWGVRPVSGWGGVAVVVTVRSGRRDVGRLRGWELVVGATVVDAAIVPGAHPGYADITPFYSDIDRDVATAVGTAVNNSANLAGRMLLRRVPHAAVVDKVVTTAADAAANNAANRAGRMLVT